MPDYDDIAGALLLDHRVHNAALYRAIAAKLRAADKTGAERMRAFILDGDAALEAAAEQEHEQWIRWSKDIAETGLTESRLGRWRSLWIPYGDLNETMKNADRKEARLLLAAIRALPTEPPA